jgi:hypothetical protein
MSRVLYSGLLLLFLLQPLWAEDPVHFADPNLKAVVEDELYVSDPTPTDMLGLTRLYAHAGGIVSLGGLEYATGLESLDVSYNQIDDISVLAGLTQLETLIINNNLITDLSPLSGLVNLTELDIHDNGLRDISDLSALTEMRTLVLRLNWISDISALSGMAHLQYLDLLQNYVLSDLSPLSGLTDLETLILRYNDVSDLSPLSGLVKLRELDLRDNQIRDVSALTTLTMLSELNLCMNPLDEAACSTDLPQIEQNNPGLNLEYDPCGARRVLISSTAGGSVAYPGEGEFFFDNAETIQVRAAANPGFVFVRWSGTCPGWSNPMFVTICDDQVIRADFVSLLDTIHVDADGPGDPLPCDPTGSDPAEDGTAEHPFDSIQEAIEVAADGVTVLVHGGTYPESIEFLGKSIQVRGEDPENPGRIAWPMIAGMPGKPVVSFTGGSNASTLLRGFVITAGRGQMAGAISCSYSRPTIANCLIVGNRANDPTGAAVYCTDSNAVLVNCTIADNACGTQGAALAAVNSQVTVVNSVLWANGPREIIQSGTGEVSTSYSLIAGGRAGSGNIDADPLFAAAGCWVNAGDPTLTAAPDDPDALWIAGDYHPQSQAGRWDPDADGWMADAATSPAIDAGDPDYPVNREPLPNGRVINMGAYGGTIRASKSP